VLVAACGESSAPAVAPDVWATVDGREIRQADVERAYRLARSPAAPISEMEALGMKLQLLDQLVTQDIALARARALGLAATDTEVDEAAAEQKRGITEEAFQQELGTRGVTVEEWKASLQGDLMIQKLIDREVISRITVTDQEIAAYYEQNTERFNLTEPHYRLAQIVVTTAKASQALNRLNDDAGTPEEARRKLDMLTGRLRAGEDFAELAADYSEDPQTSGQGGDLGFVPESALGQAAPALRDAVLKMQPGTVNTISGGGNYTIMMLVAHEPAGRRELGTPAVRDGIRDLLRGQKEELLRLAYFADARDRASVVNHLARQLAGGQGQIPAALAADTN
jgi:parvulin-like peptidyl-prolyl isomerase